MKKAFTATIIAAISLVLISSIIIALQMPEIRVKEGELVKLKVSAVDEDGDELTYTFSEPLDENGEWQTEYGDAGEYIVNVTASDGKSETTEEVRIIVEKVNRPPVIDPIDDIVVEEGDTIKVSPVASDPEGSALVFTISDPVGNDGIWEIDYEDAGEYDMTVTASDEESTSSISFKIIVKDKNRDPSIEDYYPKYSNIDLKENENVEFYVSAEDPDDDYLQYLWKLDGTEVSTDNSYTYYPDYESAGTHELSAELDDGITVLRRVWKINVEDVNRAPSVGLIDDIVINETDKLLLEFSASDPDGDNLVYSISEPIGNDKEWQTGYDDAGIYNIELSVSDGELEDITEFNLIVNDVDRAPLFKKVEDVVMTETEKVIIEFEASDPDGDKITFTSEELPNGATLNGNKLEYIPTYETVQKPGNWFNKVVNYLHLDWLFYRNRVKFDIKLTASGKDKSTSQDIRLTVRNVNRAPMMLEMDPITAEETETIKLKPRAIDYDNDRLDFSADGSFEGDLNWETGYEDSGEYNITIIVTDGEYEDSKELKITILNLNRVPELEPFKQVSIKEGQTISIPIIVNDADGNPVEIYLEDAPAGASLSNSTLDYAPSYDVSSLGQTADVIITVVASDGEATVKQSLLVKVKDENREPVMTFASPKRSITIKTNQIVLFNASAYDPDGDKLDYEWVFSPFDRVSTAEPLMARRFLVPGQKKVKLLVSDGKDSITREWIVNVLKTTEKKPVEKTEEKKTEEKATEEPKKTVEEKQETKVVTIKEECEPCPTCKTCPEVEPQKKVKRYIKFEIDNRLVEDAY